MAPTAHQPIPERSRVTIVDGLLQSPVVFLDAGFGAAANPPCRQRVATRCLDGTAVSRDVSNAAHLARSGGLSRGKGPAPDEMIEDRTHQLEPGQNAWLGKDASELVGLTRALADVQADRR
jgi:hypothetical protein